MTSGGFWTEDQGNPGLIETNHIGILITISDSVSLLINPADFAKLRKTLYTIPHVLGVTVFEKMRLIQPLTEPRHKHRTAHNLTL